MDRCFVISPIGDPQSKERSHANDVLQLIIEPAAARLGLEAVRSDRIDAAGRVSKQMFNAILQSKLTIGVLTEGNANVFYEVAIAQCAQRPLVLLLREGEDLRFDVQDLRIIRYNENFDARTLPSVIDNVVRQAQLQLDGGPVPTPAELFGSWPSATQSPSPSGATFDKCIDEIQRELTADGLFSIWSAEHDMTVPDFEYIRDIALQKLVYACTQLWNGRSESANLWICHAVDDQGRPRMLRSGMRQGYFPFDQLLDKVVAARKVFYRATVIKYDRDDLSVAAQVVRSTQPKIEQLKDSRFEGPEESLGIQWILGIPVTRIPTPATAGQPLCLTIDYLDPIAEESIEGVMQRASIVSELLTTLAQEQHT